MSSLNVLILIMYFCYQSENAFIFYVIVFWQAGHAILHASVCCFVRRSVCSALSALSLTQESVFNFLSSNCLLFKYSLCIEHSETTNIARWTGGTQSTKRERPLRTSVLSDKDHIVLLTERVTGPKFLLWSLGFVYWPTQRAGSWCSWISSRVSDFILE